MTALDDLLVMIEQKIPIDVMTTVLRGSYHEEDIRAAYDEVSNYSVTDSFKGSHYIILL